MFGRILNPTQNNCVRSIFIGSFSGKCFPAIGLNTEKYGVFPLFTPNAGKYGPEKLGTFHTVNST